jgi:hypothetical protein
MGDGTPSSCGSPEDAGAACLCGSCCSGCSNGGACVPTSNCSGSPPLCNCIPESDTQFCTSHNGCGNLIAYDNCNLPRSVNCGQNCVYPQFCGGGDGGPNECGCTPESDQAFCTMIAASCGLQSGPDNCNQLRINVYCGPCTGCGMGCLASRVCGAMCSISTYNVACQCQGQCCTGLSCGANGLTCVNNGNSRQGGICASCCSGCSYLGQCIACSDPACNGGTCCD